jgi:TetR/AcrR family transcriptional repressor of mexJK operon
MNDLIHSPSSAVRRRRIVEAAVRLFASAPYAAVHMDAIASGAGVAKPTLYRYFATKEALFVASLEWALEDMRVALEAIRREPAASEAKLRRLVALILRRTEPLAPALQAIENQSAKWGTESRRVLRQGFRHLRTEIGGLVRDGIAAGEFGAVDPDLASLVILGGIRMAAHGQAGRGAAFADSMADFLLRGLRAPAPSPAFPSSPLPSGAFA